MDELLYSCGSNAQLFLDLKHGDLWVLLHQLSHTVRVFWCGCIFWTTGPRLIFKVHPAPSEFTEAEADSCFRWALITKACTERLLVLFVGQAFLKSLNLIGQKAALQKFMASARKGRGWVESIADKLPKGRVL